MDKRKIYPGFTYEGHDGLFYVNKTHFTDELKTFVLFQRVSIQDDVATVLLCEEISDFASRVKSTVSFSSSRYHQIKKKSQKPVKKITRDLSLDQVAKALCWYYNLPKATEMRPITKDGELKLVRITYHKELALCRFS